MFVIAQALTSTDVALIAVSLVMLGLVILMGCWSIWRELYVRKLHESDSLMARDMVRTLVDVTKTIEEAIKTVENSTVITRETKSEILNAFNQAENRIMQMLQRIGDTRQFVNHFTGHNTCGDVDQAAGEMRNHG